MKYERQITWALIVILFVLILFPRVVSGYTPAPEMSLMDLKEYSGLPEPVKNMYRTQLNQNIPTLSKITDVNEYQNKLTGILNSAISNPGVAAASSSQQPRQCQPGYFSQTGNEPCVQCPMNTMCPGTGTITPTPCVSGTQSIAGSTTCVSSFKVTRET